MCCEDPGISSPRKNKQRNVTTLQQKTASAHTDTNATDVFYTYLGNLPGVFIRTLKPPHIDKPMYLGS